MIQVIQFSSVQSFILVRLFATPWIAALQASLSITSSRSLLKLMSIKSVMPSSHLILCHPLLLPPIPPSIRVFSSESTLHMRWPKYFSFSISPSSEHPGLISFRMDWLDLLAARGTLKSLLQHHSYYYLIPGIFHHHKRNLVPIRNHSYSLLFPPSGNHHLISVSVDLPIMDSSYNMWPFVFDFCYLA